MSTKVRKWVSILMSVLMLMEMVPAFAATVTCPKCGSADYEYYPSSPEYWYEPTCTEKGLVQYSLCFDCGYQEMHELPALGHNFGEWETVSAATCTEGGLERRICRRCQTEERRQTPALGHNWGEWRVEYEGTCIKQGMSYHRCRRCDKTEYRYSGYGDHKWGDWHVVKHPTPNEKGLEERECSICGKVEQRELDMIIEPIGAMLLELVSAPDSFDRANDNRVTIVYRLTNTGNTTLTASQYRPLNGADELLQDRVLTNNSGVRWSYFVPGDSYEITFSYTPTNDEIAAGELVCKFTQEGFIWISENGIPMDWEGAEGSNDTDQDNPIRSNTVTVTIPVTKLEYTGAMLLELVSAPDSFDRVNDNRVTIVYRLTNTGNTTLTASQYRPLNGADELLQDRVLTDNSGVRWSYFVPGDSYEMTFSYTPTNDEIAAGELVCKFTQEGFIWISENGIPMDWEGAEGSSGADHDNPIRSNTVTVTIPVVTPPDLPTVTKTLINAPANGTYFVPGETAVFTITFKNTTDMNLNVVELSDILVNAQGTLKTTMSQQDVFAPGAERTFIYAYEITPADAEKHFIDNHAECTLCFDPDGPEYVAASDPVYVYCNLPDANDEQIVLVKSVANPPANGAYYVEGEMITYQLKGFNCSERVLYDVSIADALSGLSGGLAQALTLEPMQVLTASFDYFVSPDDVERGYVENTASMVWYYVSDERVNLATSNTVIVDTDGIPDTSDHGITVTKKETSTPANGEFYVLGETITYEITVKNNGGFGVGLCVVNDTLINPRNNYFYDVVKLASFIQLIAGEQRTFTFSHVVDETNVADGAVKNGAEMTYVFNDQENTVTSNFVESPVGSSVFSSGVTLTTRALNAPANGLYYVAGEVIHFEVTLLSAPEQMMDVVVTDTICPDLLANEPAMTFTSPISWTFDYTVTDFVAAYGTLTSVATIDAKDINGNDLYATALLALPTGFDGGFGVITEMTIEKTETSSPANGIYYTQGETITYDIRILNDGETPFGECIIYDSQAAGNISHVEHLYVGEERHFPFSHVVTAADVAAGCVYNTAWVEYDTGAFTETKMSNTVISDTDGNPDAPCTPANPGTILPPKAAGVDAPCSRELIKKGDNGEETLTHYCGEHIDTHKAVTESVSNASDEDALLSAWTHAQALWRAEIDEMYKTLMASADALAKISVMDERIRFYASVGCHEALLRTIHPDDPVFVAEQIADMLMNKSVEMCYELNTAPASRVDAFAHVSGFELNLPGGNECAWSATALDNGDVQTTLHLCEHHASVLGIRNRLLSGGNADAAWLTVRQLWKVEVNIGYNALFAALDPEKQAVVLADYKAFEDSISAHEKVLLALYGDPAVVNEVLARDMMERATEICSIK